MNFSELFQQTQLLGKFSPDGKYLASCVSYKVIVRDTSNLQILRLYTCMDAVQAIEWSSDSLFLLCSMYKRGLVQVWSLEEPDWTCKIDEGSAGLVHAQWSPDGRHVLTTASFNLRITVWSLINKSISYIRFVKNSKNCLDFTSDGKFLALGECRKCKDYISIFSVDSWQLLKLFEVDTQDMAGLKWSPDGRVICTWDHCLWYKILIYNMNGNLITTYQAYEWALGVKRVSWSPTSQFLAVGSYDQKVRLLNHITWQSITEFSHKPKVKSADVVVFKEVEASVQLPKSETDTLLPAPAIFSSQSKYEIVEAPLNLPAIAPKTEKSLPKVGIAICEFSFDNKYLATIEESMKTCLHIWCIRTLQLVVVLQQSNPIKCVRWDPSGSRLALCTGNNKLYLWSLPGSVSIQVPITSTFLVQSLRWNSDGQSILLLSKDHMCVCYLDPSS